MNAIASTHRALFLSGLLLMLVAAPPSGAGDKEGAEAHGRGDYATALKELLPLAEQGDASAQAVLGGMYEEGQGVPQDYVHAHMWYNRASAAGVKEAAQARDILAKQMTPAQIAEAQRLLLGGAPSERSPLKQDAAHVSASEVDAVPTSPTSRPRAHAVVIGIESYQQQLPKADYAAHDAEIMRQYLTKTLGYQEENVVVLLNERATKTSMEKYVEGWLADRVEKGDSVFIYYSGHGAPNSKTGKAYLVPYDGDPAFVEQTGYLVDRLYERLATLPAKEVVVMLDSCFSGTGGRSVMAKGMRPLVLSADNPHLAKGSTMVLTAGARDQVSSTYDQKSHGLLTYFFLKGLQGDADQNHDRRIELRELFEYLKPQVERTARREFHNEQTPQLLGSPDMLSKGVVLVEGNN
jgi:hypothetical protein